MKHTIVPADGKTTGYSASGDAFPTSSVKTYTPISGHELTSITKNTTAKTVSFLYNGGVVCHNVVVEATGCKIEPSSSCVENSTQLTATITPTDASYDFTSLTVKRGSTTLTSGTHYTLSGDKKSLTINAWQSPAMQVTLSPSLPCGQRTVTSTKCLARTVPRNSEVR